MFTLELEEVKQLIEKELQAKITEYQKKITEMERSYNFLSAKYMTNCWTSYKLRMTNTVGLRKRLMISKLIKDAQRFPLTTWHNIYVEIV